MDQLLGLTLMREGKIYVPNLREVQWPAEIGRPERRELGLYLHCP